MPPAKATHLPALDGLRAIAALMVVIFHGWQQNILTGWAPWSGLMRVCVFGQTGVDLFFVLSGFLITRILIATRESPHYFGNFYLRRALRIFPLYYFFLCFYYFVLPHLLDQPIAPLGETWWYWVYLQNIPQTFRQLVCDGPGHFWSLAVEEHFYLVWPFLVYFLPVRRLYQASLGIIAAAIVSRAIFLYGFRAEVFYFTFCRMDALAVGTLLACLEATGHLAQFRRASLAILALGLPVLCLLWIFFTGERSDVMQLCKFTAIAFIYGAAICAAVCAPQNSTVRRILEGRVLGFIGTISYGLYVYHYHCMMLGLHLGGPHRTLGVLLGFAITLAVAWSSYTFLEAPFLRLKKYFPQSGIRVAAPHPGLVESTVRS